MRETLHHNGSVVRQIAHRRRSSKFPVLLDPAKPRHDLFYSDTATLESLIQEKDAEITRVRTEYYRLVEQWKQQVEDKDKIVKELTTTDTNKMKQLLILRNKVLDFEKKNEKLLSEKIKEMEGNINELRAEANMKLKQGQVAVQEVKEENEANSEITKKAFLYQFKLTEWQNNCAMLHQKITQAKYENQIELAKMKLEIEAEYEQQLEKFQQKAQ